MFRSHKILTIKKTIDLHYLLVTFSVQNDWCADDCQVQIIWDIHKWNGSVKESSFARLGSQTKLCVIPKSHMRASTVTVSCVYGNSVQIQILLFNEVMAYLATLDLLYPFTYVHFIRSMHLEQMLNAPVQFKWNLVVVRELVFHFY